MTKNEAKIIEGIQALAERPCELMSGTVVAGSLDTGQLTISVKQANANIVIHGVLLGAISNENNGIVLIPKDSSDVVIGSIDGPGIWTVLKTSKLSKAIIDIGSLRFEMEGSKIVLKNGNVTLNIGNSLFTVSTASESLFSLLNDLMTALTLLTVGTPSGTSTVPINIATFTSLQARLGNLLSA